MNRKEVKRKKVCSTHHKAIFSHFTNRYFNFFLFSFSFSRLFFLLGLQLASKQLYSNYDTCTWCCTRPSPVFSTSHTFVVSALFNLSVFLLLPFSPLHQKGRRNLLSFMFFFYDPIYLIENGKSIKQTERFLWCCHISKSTSKGNNNQWVKIK